MTPITTCMLTGTFELVILLIAMCPKEVSQTQKVTHAQKVCALSCKIRLRKKCPPGIDVTPESTAAGPHFNTPEMLCSLIPLVGPTSISRDPIYQFPLSIAIIPSLLS